MSVTMNELSVTDMEHHLCKLIATRKEHYNR
jgi:hypothetical protein